MPKSKEPSFEKKVNYLASFPNLIELVVDESGDLEYMIYDPETKTPFYSKVIERDRKIYQPPPKNALPLDLLFPKKDNIIKYYRERQMVTIGDDIGIEENGENRANLCQWDIDLYDQIEQYLRDRSELPQDNLYNVLVLWVFHTYCQEKSDFSPIIYFLGTAEKGKSRMLKSLTYISKRGIRKIGITDAQILRDCTHLEATLAMDIRDLWKKLSESGSEDVFLNRPERGVTVSRVNRPDRGAFQDTDYYTVFGPTIFATNELIDEILDTRAIPIIMVKSKKSFAGRIKPIHGLEIKEKLTAWRAATFGKTIKEQEPIAKSRLGDITQPIADLVYAMRPDKIDEVKEVVSEIEKRRLSEKADSLNGQIVRALLGCVNMVEHGMLKCQIITNEFNKDKGEREKYSSRRILNRLKTMGFDVGIVHGGVAAVYWNTELIDSLTLEFGIDSEQNGDILSPNSSTPTSPPNVTKEPTIEMYYAELGDNES